MREVLLLGPGPELADVLVGLDSLVPKLEAVFGPLGADAPDVEGSYHIAEVIELDRSTRRVGEIDRLEGLHELLFVVSLATRRLERGVDHLAIRINAGGVEAGNGIVVLQDPVDEALVAIALEVERVRA